MLLQDLLLSIQFMMSPSSVTEIASMTRLVCRVESVTLTHILFDVLLFERGEERRGGLCPVGGIWFLKCMLC